MKSVPDLPQDLTLRLMPEDWLNPMSFDGVWRETGPRIVDIGCGKGRFILAHARLNPDAQIFGIERKLRRVRKIDRKAVRAGLGNIRLMRMEGYYALRYLMPPAWMDVCFVYFPDPWPKPKHQGHRLFCPEFIDGIDRTLAPEGVVHFATDHAPYFDEVSALIAADSRWEPAPIYIPHEDEVSDFELVWRDHKPIGRLSFRRKLPVIPLDSPSID